MSLTRREFLTHAGGGVTLAATALTLPRIFLRTAAAAAGIEDRTGRILVVLQLTGGNDGLNTIVPYRDDEYHRLRPNLAIGREQVQRLNDDVGLAQGLAPLKRLFDEGRLAVIQGVGYPNPNRSHFQSMDIWHSADPALTRTDTGWLGRAIARERALSALHLSDEPLPLALRGDGVDVPSVRSIESFRLQGGADGASTTAIRRVLGAGAGELSATAPPGSSDADFIRRTALCACENARRLEALPAGDPGRYPDLGLARRLHEIARLIAADFGPRIYYTSLGGFDTHARQSGQHALLMTEIGQSVGAFFDDLKQRGLGERVVLMTFSEFGRRAAENESLGTDHGAAAPVLLAGAAVKAGVIGPRPDLSQLVDGDVPHAIDFRSVYAAMLDDWLGVPAQSVLEAPAGRIDVLS